MTLTTATDAFSSLNSILSRYGLDALVPWLRQSIVEGKSEEELLAELYARPEFAARFPAIDARRRAGLPPMSPEEYIQYERTLDQQMGRFGMLPGFRAGGNTFNQLVTGLLESDVSIDEANNRIEHGYAQVRNAPPEIRNYFEQTFGVHGDSALAAFFLAPDHAESELNRMVRESEIGGTATRFGINLDHTTADTLSRMNIDGNGETQFAQLNQLQPLFDERVSEAPVDLNINEQGVAAAFNTDPNAQRTLERRLSERQASTGGGGGGAETQQGVVGFGTAR